jgi:hypothetical protein
MQDDIEKKEIIEIYDTVTAELIDTVYGFQSFMDSNKEKYFVNRKSIKAECYNVIKQHIDTITISK